MKGEGRGVVPALELRRGHVRRECRARPDERRRRDQRHLLAGTTRPTTSPGEQPTTPTTTPTTPTTDTRQPTAGQRDRRAVARPGDPALRRGRSGFGRTRTSRPTRPRRTRQGSSWSAAANLSAGPRRRPRRTPSDARPAPRAPPRPPSSENPSAPVGGGAGIVGGTGIVTIQVVLIPGEAGLPPGRPRESTRSYRGGEGLWPSRALIWASTSSVGTTPRRASSSPRRVSTRRSSARSRGARKSPSG